MLNTLTLTGLMPNNPMAAMAAYGALRLLPDATLAWPDGGHPVLTCEGDPVARLAVLLPARRVAPENNIIDAPSKITDLRAIAGRMPQEWAVAYASETEDGIEDTALKVMGGRHLMVDSARRVMDALIRGSEVEARLREVLIGPWRYQDADVQAWGWDAGANIDAAASSRPGSSTPKFAVLGAAWLAWEAIPLFPAFHGETVGWTRGLCYPTVARPVGWHELRAIVLGLRNLSEHEARALGLRVWWAAKIPSGTHGHVLGWASESARTGSGSVVRRGSRN